ncbi:MAG: MATE family efflux transporter [Thermomicrobiales bacterium]|nr:MATE family efflux transporter [Thermomicrobiales bacterium]
MPTGPADQIPVLEETVALEAILAPAELIAPIAADPITAPTAGPMTQRRVLGLALPIIGENLLQTSVGAVDTFMVAHLGSAAVAGVGAALEIVFFIIAILTAVDIGATVLVSQAIGAGDRAGANSLARQAVVWGVLLAIPVSIVGYFAAPTIMSLFATEPDVTANAVTYLRITAATSTALLLSFICGAVLRGAGDSRTPLYAAVVANLVNVAVAYGFIFGKFGLPELGLAGSALGAAVGRAVGAALLLALMAFGHKAISLNGREGWAPSLEIGRRLFRLGIPAAIEQMLIAGGFTSMMAVVAMIGTSALAAQQIGFTALSIAFLPGFGFAIAATALVGQSIGAKDIAAARTAAAIATRWGVIWMAAGSALYFVFASQVMSVFTQEPAVHDAGVAALRALSMSLPFWAVWSVAGGGLRGSGDTRTPMIVGALAVWSAVIIAFVGVRGFDFGLGAVWLTFLVTVPPAALANAVLMRRRLNRDIATLAVSSEPLHGVA